MGQRTSTNTLDQTTISFMSVQEIDSWLESDLHTFLTLLAKGGLSVVEHLTNDIIAPGDSGFAVASEQATRLFSRIDHALADESDSVGQQLATILGVLTTFLVEAGPYRFEVKQTPTKSAISDLLSAYREIRLRALTVTSRLFDHAIFDPIRDAVELEIKPTLVSICEQVDGRDERYLPFRVLTAGTLSEQLRLIRIRLDLNRHQALDSTLSAMYDLKYMRFGTSGYRGVWNRDFTPEKARIISQAICDYLKQQNMPAYAEGSSADLTGKTIVISYDGRRNSQNVSRIVAETFLANGFRVYFAAAPTPTPALNYFAREFVNVDNLAGMINCTASHNPPEWQGIKFNPTHGYPAPTNVTDVIGSRASARQLLNQAPPKGDLERAENNGDFRQFDPKDMYLNWLRQAGTDDDPYRRIKVDFSAIKQYFADKWIVLDPMYGSGRGYLSKVLGELGVPHTSIHDERDEDLGWQTEVTRGIPHLAYANPEPHFIQPLVDQVREQGAAIGLGLDTDADRFGAVDQGGVYIRPNEILAMLTRYLGVDRGETGRVVITQTGLPMIDAIAGLIPGNDTFRPPVGSVPAYTTHAFYHLRVGSPADVAFMNTYVTPVGIKYLIDVARVPDQVSDPKDAFKTESDAALPRNWMSRLLIAGEESSGLTTRGHVPDKDGVWANLLILDMLAYYGLRSDSGKTSLTEIWNDTTALSGAWKTYGGRIDLDTTTEAKETLINDFLDRFTGWTPGDALPQLGGLDIYYLGGTRYDFVEIFLEDRVHGRKHFVRIRSSGTEPITRLYVESADRAIGQHLTAVVLDRLDELNMQIIQRVSYTNQFVDTLANTRLAPKAGAAAIEVMQRLGTNAEEISARLMERKPHVESRNVELIDKWSETLLGA